MDSVKKYNYRILNIIRRFEAKNFQKLCFMFKSHESDWCQLEGCICFPADDTITFNLVGRVTKQDSQEHKNRRMCCTLWLSEKVSYGFGSQLEWQDLELRNSAITLTRQELVDLNVVFKDTVETKWVITNHPSSPSEESKIQFDKFSMFLSPISRVLTSPNVDPLSKKLGAETKHVYRILNTTRRLETETPQNICFNLTTLLDGQCEFEGNIYFPGDGSIKFTLSGKTTAQTSVEALKEKYFMIKLSDDAVHYYSRLRWQLDKVGYHIKNINFTLSKQELLNLNVIKQDSISTSWMIKDKKPDLPQVKKIVNTPTEKMQFSAEDFIHAFNVSIKSGILRKKPKTENGRWKHRFIVLLSDSLYIYNSELSKSPNDTILLRGYNRVQREEQSVHEWCFSILPAYNLKTVRVITLSCVSDNERREWMRVIQNQIYASNSIVNEDNAQSEAKLISSLGTVNENNNESDVFQAEENFTGDSVFRNTRDGDNPPWTDDRLAKLGAKLMVNCVAALPPRMVEKENRAKSKNTLTRSLSEPPKHLPGYRCMNS